MTVADSHLAWPEFVQANMEALKRYARSRLRYHDVPTARLEPDDAVNYALAELFERWDQVSDPRGYAFTVIRRHVQRAAFEGARFTGGELTDETAVEIEVAPCTLGQESARLTRPADEAALDRIRAGQLYAAMKNLSPQQYQAVELLELRGVTRAEAAQEMKVAAGTVSAHRDRAWKRLRSGLTGFLAVIIVIVAVAGMVPSAWRNLLNAAAQWLQAFLGSKPDLSAVPDGVWLASWGILMLVWVPILAQAALTRKLSVLRWQLKVAAGHALDLLDIETDPVQREQIRRELDALREKIARAPAKFQAKLIKDQVLLKLMEGADQDRRQQAGGSR